jgi:hypothetical protein
VGPSSLWACIWPGVGDELYGASNAYGRSQYRARIRWNWGMPLWPGSIFLGVFRIRLSRNSEHTVSIVPLIGLFSISTYMKSYYAAATTN